MVTLVISRRGRAWTTRSEGISHVFPSIIGADDHGAFKPLPSAAPVMQLAASHSTCWMGSTAVARVGVPSPTGSDGFAFEEVDEPCLAKVFAGVVAGFGDAIGVQDQPVAGLESHRHCSRGRGRADSTLVSRSPREPEALDAVEQGSPQPAAVVGFGATKKLAADGSRLGSGMSRAD